MKMLTPTQQRARKMPEDALPFIFHESFLDDDAVQKYAGPDEATDGNFAIGYMPEEVTRAVAARMHFAAYQYEHARGLERPRWKVRYFQLRDRIILGNRKLIYRAVQRQMQNATVAEDLVGDRQLVLIKAVALYNPWLGVRFSTYAYSCLMRALHRLGNRRSMDNVLRSVPLDMLPGNETAPGDTGSPQEFHFEELTQYFGADSGLLSEREKKILIRRFELDEPAKGSTLKELGEELGLSKERIRQLQARHRQAAGSALCGGGVRRFLPTRLSIEIKDLHHKIVLDLFFWRLSPAREERPWATFPKVHAGIWPTSSSNTLSMTIHAMLCISTCI